MNYPALAPPNTTALIQPLGDGEQSLVTSSVLIISDVAAYVPPPCEFDHVVINFTTVVKGRQFDRTGVMYLGDNEVWRTSTAEPTSYGIRWEWLKDMTPFLSLWKQPQICQ